MASKLPEKKGRSQIDKLREDVIEKLFDIKEHYINHIAASIQATKPCLQCSIDQQGKVVAGKKDVNGHCLACHGTMIVPDTTQRNWAAEQAQPILAPAPKQIEVSNESQSNLADVQEAVKGLSDKDLTDKIKELGFLNVSKIT